MTLKLTVELVPRTSWFTNVRSAVTKAQWDAIRSVVYSKAYYICEICGGVGPKHPVECHEIWKYNDSKGIRKLTGMIALCPDCHMVKHYGLSKIQAREDHAFRHFIKVNKLTPGRARAYIDAAFDLWHARSELNWIVDISHLKEYGIDISKWLRKK